VAERETIQAEGTRAASPHTGDAVHAAPAASLAAASELLAQLAHELRTPLGAIISLAELLRDQRFGPLGNQRYAEYSADIYRSAHHALAVVNAMLDRETLGTGRPVFAFAEIDLNAVTDGCVTMVGPMAAAAGVTVGFAAAERLPRIIADPRSVRQMLINLLGNALRHAPRGSTVRVWTSYALDGPVSLSVADEGAGLTGADIARLLDAGASARALQPARDGAPPVGGIGIPLVRALAVANGAELRLESAAGSGLVASIVFAKDHVLPV